MTQGYLFAYIIYFFITIFGSIGCMGRKDIDSSIRIITDLFPEDSIAILIVSCFFSFQLFTVIPIVIYISRNQFFYLFYSNEEEPSFWVEILTNFIIIGLMILFQMLVVNPTILIGIDGTLCCYLIIYVICYLLRRESRK